jgi:predicted lysophospholipase L1 biosynthesis ABC-type transport system permease subunit
MSRGRKLGLVLLAGIAFGVLVAVVKGQHTGVRNALGNTSAPWMLAPFLAGALYPRL